MTRGGLKRLTGTTIIVHQRSGPSIRGILGRAYRDCFVLVNARSLDDKADLGGEVVIPRASGVWIQAHVQESE